MRTQISDKNVNIYTIKNNLFVLVKVFWLLFCGVFTHLEFVSSFFSSFPLVLFHYISDLGHVIGRCSAQFLSYLLTYSDSRRLSEIVSY